MKRSPILNQPLNPAPRHDQIICCANLYPATRADGTELQVGDYAVDRLGAVAKRIKRSGITRWTVVKTSEVSEVIHALSDINPTRAALVHDRYWKYAS